MRSEREPRGNLLLQCSPVVIFRSGLHQPLFFRVQQLAPERPEHTGPVKETSPTVE